MWRKDYAGTGAVQSYSVNASTGVPLAPGRWEVMIVPPRGYYVSAFGGPQKPAARPDGWNEINVGFLGRVSATISGGPAAVHGGVRQAGQSRGGRSRLYRRMGSQHAHPHGRSSRNADRCDGQLPARQSRAGRLPCSRDVRLRGSNAAGFRQPRSHCRSTREDQRYGSRSGSLGEPLPIWGRADCIRVSTDAAPC